MEVEKYTEIIFDQQGIVIGYEDVQNNGFMEWYKPKISLKQLLEEQGVIIVKKDQLMTDKTLKQFTDVLERLEENIKFDLSMTLRSQEVLLNKNFEDEILAMTAEGLELKKLMIKKQRELFERLSGKILGMEGLMSASKK